MSEGEPVRRRVNRGGYLPVPMSRRAKSRGGNKQTSSLTVRNSPPTFKMNISCREILDKFVSLVGQIPFAYSIMFNAFMTMGPFKKYVTGLGGRGVRQNSDKQ